MLRFVGFLLAVLLGLLVEGSIVHLTKLNRIGQA